MIKKITKITLIFTLLFTLSGCNFKRDNMENIEIYITNYPIEYITTKLYGSHSTIHSIYPNGINIDNYKLTKKQITDYSNSDLYIFNGQNHKEKEYVNKMREKNKNLKIIDTTLYMEYINGVEELWLDPSNFLMMAQNIKVGFSEYINNYYLNNDIDKNYESLKIDVSNLDAKIKSTVEKANSTTLVASSKMFKYLEKYGLKVYTFDNIKDMEKIKSLINENKIKYIFIKDTEEVSDEIKNLINGTNIKTQSWYTLSNISEDKKNSNADYFTIMNENIDSLKNELYS